MITLTRSNREQMINLSSNNQTNKQIKWATDKSCPYVTTPLYLDIFKEYSIDKTKDDDWMIYIPCNYDDPPNEINKIHPTSPQQKIFMVTNTNELASKSNMWTNLVKKYGKDMACTMAPKSYVLYDNNDLELFKKEYDPNKLYIMKKNIQRQEGLKITNDKNVVLNGAKDMYVVAQELLQDPFMINGRKINMRFYVLLICQNNAISAYVHNEGFMYYTKMPFQKNSQKNGTNVTTGYIERWIYHVNPLTHGDFRKYLGEKHEEVFNRIYELIRKVIQATDDKICQDSHLKPYVTFQLFGVDIALNNKLIPQIMEVNVGPNLETLDPRDAEVKGSVFRDLLKLLNVVPNENNNFIRII
jgi:hypothetical protein